MEETEFEMGRERTGDELGEKEEKERQQHTCVKTLTSLRECQEGKDVRINGQNQSN